MLWEIGIKIDGDEGVSKSFACNAMLLGDRDTDILRVW